MEVGCCGLCCFSNESLPLSSLAREGEGGEGDILNPHKTKLGDDPAGLCGAGRTAGRQDARATCNHQHAACIAKCRGRRHCRVCWADPGTGIQRQEHCPLRNAATGTIVGIDARDRRWPPHAAVPLQQGGFSPEHWLKYGYDNARVGGTKQQRARPPAPKQGGVRWACVAIQEVLAALCLTNARLSGCTLVSQRCMAHIRELGGKGRVGHQGHQ
jgi:hypothetical protein